MHSYGRPNGLMRAQVLTAPKKLEYRRITVPKPGAREVLVKMRTAAICNGSDPSILDGHDAYPMPLVFGHEPFGEIAALGEDIEGFAVGDRVCWWFSLGAFAEYVAVNPAQVAMVKVPETIPENEAPILELVAASARAVRESDMASSSRVLILGLGPSGLLMSQRAKALGASIVVGWDLYPMRREKGLCLGCDAALDPRDRDAIAETRKCLGEADIVIDAMGNDALPEESTLDFALQILRHGGKIVSYGHPCRGRRFNPYLFQGKNAVMCSPEQDIKKIRELMATGLAQIADGRLKLAPLISDAMPLSRVAQGLALVRNHPDEHLKIIIRIDESEE